MPTRAGWILLAGVALAAGLGRLFGTVELFVLAAIGLVVLLSALVLVRRPFPDLRVHRTVTPGRVVAGGFARVEVHVASRSRRSPVVALVDPVEGTVGARLVLGPIAAGDGEVVGYRLPTRRRGVLRVGPLRAEVTDPFGLARRRRALAGDHPVTILPAIDPVEGVPVGAGRHHPLAGQRHRAMASAVADDLATLRPYQLGDDLRRVHWPSSARSDDLQVRRDEEEWQGHLTVLLDTDPAGLAPDDFERAVSAAAGFVHAASASGDQVRLIAGANDSGMVDARRFEAVLLEQLALVGQDPEPGVDAIGPGHLEPSSLVVVRGDRARTAAAALAPPEHGFDPVVHVVLASGDGTGEGWPGHVHVGPGERVGDAWRRAARATPELWGAR